MKFNSEINVINIGSPSFLKDYDRQNISYVHLEWRPPASGKPVLIEALKKIKRHEQKIKAANQTALKRILDAEAQLIDIQPAIKVIPQMHEKLFLHSGPPIKWEDMAGPMKGAILGAIIYEGMAVTTEDAEKLVGEGGIEFDSAHNHAAVGPMAGIISPSMPVHVLKDKNTQNCAFCTVNEGLGKVLRYGANSPEVIERLKWIESDYMPILAKALEKSGGVDVRRIIAEALHMGDECHNRNKAATALFFREIAPYIAQTGFPQSEIQAALNFIKGNEHYFLNLSMPYAKLALDSAQGVKFSSVVTIMSRNGKAFGIRFSGSPKWYVGEANYVKGLMFPGFSESDAARDIGDSAITETAGIGGFAMGGAPAIVQFVGGEVEQAFNYSREMHEITVGRHRIFTLPTLDFMPTALGIDILRVVESGILPIINTGMAHKEAGVGQVGAGLVHPPMSCFEEAVLDFADILEEESLCELCLH